MEEFLLLQPYICQEMQRVLGANEDRKPGANEAVLRQISIWLCTGTIPACPRVASDNTRRFNQPVRLYTPYHTLPDYTYTYIHTLPILLCTITYPILSYPVTPHPTTITSPLYTPTPTPGTCMAPGWHPSSHPWHLV